MNSMEKQAIAERAARLVEPGQTLFVDRSTTCIYLARVLAERRRGLTVSTNSAPMCLKLAQSRDNTVVGFGGQHDPDSAPVAAPDPTDPTDPQ